MYKYNLSYANQNMICYKTNHFRGNYVLYEMIYKVRLDDIYVLLK